MTEQRKRRLKYKIQESRGRIMENHPFFALLLMYLKFVAVPDMKKISTNGRCIYFSPDFVDKLYIHELDYILCHQIMHIITGQIWRPKDLAGDDYHFACDILINTYLSDYGFDDERYAHLGEVHKKIPACGDDPAGLTPEEICNLIPFSLYWLDDRARSRFLPDNDLWWDQKEDEGLFGELILDIDESDGMLRESAGNKTDNKAENEAENKAKNGKEDDAEDGRSTGGDLQQAWYARAGAAASAMDAFENGYGNGTGDSSGDEKGIGKIPGFVKRMLAKMKEPTVDWRKLLHNFVQERVCDYSFSPPDRRFADTGFFLPDFNEKDFITKEILFMVDTSGSIDDDDLAIVYSEIRGAIEQFSGKLTGKLGFFDAAVTPPLPFENISDLLKIIPYGGGGTDFRVIFEYIRMTYRNDLPACVVIFTDGEGPYPDESQTMGIPVLWMINNPDITPPFGITTRIIPTASSIRKLQTD